MALVVVGGDVDAIRRRSEVGPRRDKLHELMCRVAQPDDVAVRDEDMAAGEEDLADGERLEEAHAVEEEWCAAEVDLW